MIHAGFSQLCKPVVVKVRSSEVARMLGFYVLLEDPDANVIIALALHSALLQLGFYAALRPHIASHSVCPSVPLSDEVFFYFTVEPSYERTSKIEKLRFSLMGQRHVCTFRHALRAADRTAISAAHILVITRPTMPIGCCIFACCQRPRLISNIA